jgi:carbonic anhydrase
VLGIRDVVVCGHSDCGAMKALLHPEVLDGLPQVRHWLRHAQTARHVVEAEGPEHDPQARLRRVTEENVLAQVVHLLTYPFIASRVARDEIRLHAWYYDIESGTIFACDAADGRFRHLDAERLQHVTPPARTARRGA